MTRVRDELMPGTKKLANALKDKIADIDAYAEYIG